MCAVYVFKVKVFRFVQKSILMVLMMTSCKLPDGFMMLQVEVLRHSSPIMSDMSDSSLNINLIKESVLKRLCETLDKTSNKGWRKLGEIVKNDRRFKMR